MRTLKNVKYLGSFGWEPLVLTLREEYYPPSALDPALMTQIPEGIQILRTASLRRSHHKTSTNGILMDRTHVGQVSRHQLIARLRQFLRSEFFVYQDTAALWLPYAIPLALRLAREALVDVVYTTSPPHWTHIIGYCVKKLAHKPWVIDFRDGWVGNPLFTAEGRLRRKIDRWLEGLVVRNADYVVSATPAIHRQLTSRYPEMHSHSAVITNGFDEEDFALEPKRLEPSAFTIAHVGSLGFYRPLTHFVAAVEELLHQGDLSPTTFQIVFCGTLSEQNSEPLQRIKSVVHVVGQVPHSEALEVMLGADALLLVTGAAEKDSAFSGKVFEYIRAGRPILALIRSGDLADLILSNDLGLTCDPESVSDIKSCILQLHRGSTDDAAYSLPRDDSILRQFDRRVLAQRLANILDSVVATG